MTGFAKSLGTRTHRAAEIFARPAAIIFSLACMTAISAAQSPQQVETDKLQNYYRLELAVAICPSIAPTGRDLIRLDDAIRKSADKLDLPEQELEALVINLERDARANQDTFCKSMEFAVRNICAIPLAGS